MDHYHIWVDLKPGVKDFEFVAATEGMLGHLRGLGKLEGYTVARRKLGFGPDGIGEWHVDIRTHNMAQLEQAFDHVTPRTGEIERMHAMVWSKVTNFKAGLYRDFPDQNRLPDAPATN